MLEKSEFTKLFSPPNFPTIRYARGRDLYLFLSTIVLNRRDQQGVSSARNCKNIICLPTSLTTTIGLPYILLFMASIFSRSKLILLFAGTFRSFVLLTCTQNYAHNIIRVGTWHLVYAWLGLGKSALSAKCILLQGILHLHSFHTDKVAIDGQVYLQDGRFLGFNHTHAVMWDCSLASPSSSSMA